MSSRTASSSGPLASPSSATMPKYVEILNELRDEFRHAPSGSRIPTERALATRFGVSRMTLRQALDELQAEGRVERVRGNGTFVRRPTVAMGPRLTSFTEDMRSRGLMPSSRLLALSIVPAGADVADVLGVAADDEVVLMERLRFADGEPMCLEVTQLPLRLQRVLERGDLEGSLHALLKKEGIDITSLTRRVRAVAVEPREARLLDLPDGAPTLEVLDVFYDVEGRCVQRASSRYRYDRYEVMNQIGDRSTHGHRP